MFWKIAEFLIRLIHYKRFRQAEKIGVAAELAGAGRLSEALADLDMLRSKLHPSLRSIHALTRGRILDASGDTDAAESAFVEAALADPSNAKAHLDLAVIAGRRFRFDDARERLMALVQDGDGELKVEAREILELLEQVTSGQRQSEFERRATAMSERPIGPHGESAGLPANLQLLDSWITREPERARDSADELALLLGQSDVLENKSNWKISLSLEESFVVRPDGTEIHPFEIVSRRMSSHDVQLPDLVSGTRG